MGDIELEDKINFGFYDGELEIEKEADLGALELDVKYVGGGTADYRELTNKPKINGVTLLGNKSSNELGLQDIFQYESLERVVGQEGQIVQYIGETDDNYTNGFFYKYTEEHGWQKTSVQDTISDHSLLTNLDYEHAGHTGFQATINDLAEIREGAALGATAVQDPDYVHTDNNYTDAEKTKLAGLENYDDTTVWEAINEHDREIQNIENDIDELQSDVEDLGTAVDTLETTKQDKLTAGANVQISNNNVISATDTTYTAGAGIKIENNVIE